MDHCPQGHPLGESSSAVPGDDSSAAARYQAFLDAVNAPGALDGRTKRAIGIALAVLARCEPCLKYHLKGARDLGFSAAAIDEAAWLGIAFGGTPSRAFYHTVRHGQR